MLVFSNREYGLMLDKEPSLSRSTRKSGNLGSVGQGMSSYEALHFPYGGEHGSNLVTAHCWNQETQNEEKMVELISQASILNHIMDVNNWEEENSSQFEIQGNGSRKYNFMYLPLNSR